LPSDWEGPDERHKGMRIIDKHGIEKVVADLRAAGTHV
jgi:hypothetical protein